MSDDDSDPEMTEADLERLRNLQWSDIQDENGVDLTQIDYMLSLTPTQRLEAMQRLAESEAALTEARVKFYGRDPRADIEAGFGRG